MPGPREFPSRSHYDVWWEREPYTDAERDDLAAEIVANPDRIVRPNWDPGWAELCRRAEAWGLQVHLSIKRGPAVGPPDRRFHHFDLLTLRSTPTSPPVISVYVSHMNGGLHTAALRVLEKLQDAA